MHVYCYPDSDVLKNRMGMRDMEQQQSVHRGLASRTI